VSKVELKWQGRMASQRTHLDDELQGSGQ